MTIAFIPKETLPGETRVAAVPETVRRLVKAGLTLRVETGAGEAAFVTDEALRAEGAVIAGSESWSQADVVLKVQPPTPEEAGRLKKGCVLVSFVNAGDNLASVERLRERNVTTLAMELIPRISRAQSMDALSSQATVAGYKAVLLGASHLPKLCPLLMTAAGTIAPAKVVVFGAGVAGLQAIATSRRLGCVVEATDVRLAVKEQVESLGARFIDVPGAENLEDERGYAKEASAEFLARQKQEVKKRVCEADLVITTAQIPGRRAPVLIDAGTVQSMKKGAVIVDLAVDSGGNCELSVPGEIVVRHGVTLIGVRNLPATVPLHASELYAKNVFALIKPFIGKDGTLALDLADAVVAGCLLTHDGEVRHEPTAALLAQGVTS